MSNIYHMDMASIMVGDTNPNDINSIKIEEIKLPVLQEVTVEHKGGGSIMGIEIGMNLLQKLELSFKMKGLSPEVFRELGIGRRRRTSYTIRGNVVDLREDRRFPAKCVVQGRMIKLDQGSFDRDKGISEDYQIAEIVHYELFLDGQEKFYFNYFQGPAGARIDGQIIFADEARNLGLV